MQFNFYNAGQPKSSVCEICGQHFPKENSLVNHRIRKHQVWLTASAEEGQRRGAQCQVCDKWFPFRTMMLEHMTLHTGAF